MSGNSTKGPETVTKRLLDPDNPADRATLHLTDQAMVQRAHEAGQAVGRSGAIMEAADWLMTTPGSRHLGVQLLEHFRLPVLPPGYSVEKVRSWWRTRYRWVNPHVMDLGRFPIRTLNRTRTAAEVEAWADNDQGLPF